MISEKAVAESITPAPKPSSASDRRAGMVFTTSTGIAPRAVPKAQSRPPFNASTMGAGRLSSASNRAWRPSR